MVEQFNLIAVPLFAVSATLYLLLAMRVARAASSSENNAISYFLFLIGIWVGGTAFSYQATDENLFGIGRTLIMFSSGFMPVIFYSIYRQYTSAPASFVTLAVLSLVPAVTVLLAVTNPWHGLVWAVADGGTRFTNASEHVWTSRIFMPFAFGLFGYAVVALTGRLPTIARAHRAKIVVLIVCGSLPFIVSLANNALGIGPISFPFTALTLTMMLPLYWWTTMKMRVYDFSPLAYQTMFDHVRDPIIVLDKSQRIISANRPAQTLLEADEQELVGERLWPDIPEAQAVLDHARERDLNQTVRIKDDRYFELNSKPLLGSSGTSQGTVVVCRDVTERRKVLRALADSEHLIRSLVETSSNGLLRFARDPEDAGGRYRCTYANRAAVEYLQSGGALVGMPLAKLPVLDPEKLIGHFAGDDLPNSGINYEASIERDSGDMWLRVVAEPVGNDFSVTLIDITARKRVEKKIIKDALHDPLTGALNRRGFERLAVRSLARQPRGAVVYLDLNRFKAINDQLGHQSGDALLKAFAKRLEFCLRPEDLLGRLGGDEFVIVLPGVAIDDARRIAHRLVESASDPYIIHGEEIDCTASMGIALMPKHGDDLWQLVSVADKAMYGSKSLSREDRDLDRGALVEAAIAS